MKKVSLILAAVIAMSSMTMFTGCGGSSDETTGNTVDNSVTEQQKENVTYDFKEIANNILNKYDSEFTNVGSWAMLKYTDDSLTFSWSADGSYSFPSDFSYNEYKALMAMTEELNQTFGVDEEISNAMLEAADYDRYDYAEFYGKSIKGVWLNMQGQGLSVTYYTENLN